MKRIFLTTSYVYFGPIKQNSKHVGKVYKSLCTRRIFKAPMTHIIRTHAHGMANVDNQKAVLSASDFRLQRVSKRHLYVDGALIKRRVQILLVVWCVKACNTYNEELRFPNTLNENSL